MPYTLLAEENPDETIAALTAKTENLQQELTALRQEMAKLTASKNQTPTYLYTLPYVGVPVITSPYLDKQPEFNGSDLIVNMSDNNLDTSLMEQRQMMENKNLIPSVPLIMLSGTVQPIGLMEQSSYGSTTGTTALYYLELDTAVMMNSWVEGLFSVTAGASAYSVLTRTHPTSLSSSDLELFVDDAFVNIGNLNKTPFYLTAGQAYLPFGEYQTNMVTWPAITAIGQTRMPAAMIGYSSGANNGFLGTLFAYNTNTTLGKSGAGGGSLTYQFGNNDISGNVAGSIISNIADAGGMQNTGISDGSFAGFGESNATENINQVPGYDFNGVLNLGAYSILAEYVSAVRAFPTSALSYNGNGAQPMGGNVEAAYTFTAFKKPATVALGYGWTNESLALALPQQRFSAVFNISWWRDTVEALEFRHDIEYSASDYADGIGGTAITQGPGGYNDTVTASIAAYF